MASPGAQLDSFSIQPADETFVRSTNCPIREPTVRMAPRDFSRRVVGDRIGVAGRNGHDIGRDIAAIELLQNCD